MKSDNKTYRFFFGRRGERHLPFGAMLLILVPFLIVGQYFQNRKYNALSASPEHTSTVISNIGYIGNSGPIIHYSFTVNGVTYNGGMHANGFAVGDSIGVVYQKDNPENNMTVFEYYDGPSYGFVSAFVILVVILAIIRWRKISRQYKADAPVETKVQRACGIYRTSKEYIFVTGYGKTGFGYNMNYPIKFAPIDCDDIEFNNAFGEVFLASNREEYKELKSSELIKAMKQRSWRQLHLHSTSVFVNQDDDKISVVPTKLASDKWLDWDSNQALTFDVGNDSIYDIVSETRKLLDNHETDR